MAVMLRVLVGWTNISDVCRTPSMIEDLRAEKRSREYAAMPPSFMNEASGLRRCSSSRLRLELEDKDFPDPKSAEGDSTVNPAIEPIPDELLRVSALCGT